MIFWNFNLVNFGYSDICNFNFLRLCVGNNYQEIPHLQVMKVHNFSLIIIGYGLVSLGMMFMMLFIQTLGSAWLIFGSITFVGAIWIIRKERIDSKAETLQREFLDMDFSECIKCGELRFDKKINRCVSCDY